MRGIVEKYLRVIECGVIDPLKSQAIYHGLASSLSNECQPILVISQPSQPYVCIGLHQDLDEIDVSYCQKNNLPIIRRHVGGGTVYLDQHQLFFHFVFPQKKAPNRIADLYPFFIRPVIETYQAFGIKAYLKLPNDIQVNGRKLGGTGAATIENATVMVGSFLYDFDYQTMGDCLNVPSAEFRQTFIELLREHMTTIQQSIRPVPTYQQLTAIFLQNIQQHCQLSIQPSQLMSREYEQISMAENELASPEWLFQPGRRLIPNGVKIASHTYLLEINLPSMGDEMRMLLLQKDGKVGGCQLVNQVGLRVYSDVFERLSGVALTECALHKHFMRLSTGNVNDVHGLMNPQIIRDILSGICRIDL